jgi:nicotinamidase-related amidase
LKPALLVIDVQNQFLPLMAEDHRRVAPYLINATIDLFRAKGLPIYCVHHTDPVYGPAPDSDGFAFDPAIRIAPGDTKVVKTFPNAFKNTPLERLLRDADVDTVFLCGLSATGCVLATYFGAKNLDLKAFMVRDALLGPNAAHTQCVQDICDSANFFVVQTMLESVTAAV